MVSKASEDLARAGQAGEHHQLAARDVDADVLQIVLARAADRDHAAIAAAGTFVVSSALFVGAEAVGHCETVSLPPRRALPGDRTSGNAERSENTAVLPVLPCLLSQSKSPSLGRHRSGTVPQPAAKPCRLTPCVSPQNKIRTHTEPGLSRLGLESMWKMPKKPVAGWCAETLRH